ncbi:MAG: hypothetical protein EHJ94_04210 [Deltaproteobacteria bacterium]|nr:MAG: hypothetical protein EHJ94_04210 [Deltaproteobacteria bacterium]
MLNRADKSIQRLAATSRATNLFFDSEGEQENTAIINYEKIYLPMNIDGKRHIIDQSETTLVGKHNQENIAAASLATLAAGGNIEGIRSALKSFKGLPHRLEYVATVGQVRYIDDSKATNVDAVLRALEVFDGKVILIMGGLDKGGEYGVLKNQLLEKVRLILVIGEARKIIQKSLGGYTEITEVSSMADAVSMAHERSVPGDTVLLSPACSSFDMFDSYAHRGDVFCQAVRKIQERYL